MIKYTVKAKIIKGKIDNQTIFESFDKEFVMLSPHGYIEALVLLIEKE